MNQTVNQLAFTNYFNQVNSIIKNDFKKELILSPELIEDIKFDREILLTPQESANRIEKYYPHNYEEHEQIEF